jgi:S1-C subfamily serine protease
MHQCHKWRFRWYIPAILLVHACAYSTNKTTETVGVTGGLDYSHNLLSDTRHSLEVAVSPGLLETDSSIKDRLDSFAWGFAERTCKEGDFSIFDKTAVIASFMKRKKRYLVACERKDVASGPEQSERRPHTPSPLKERRQASSGTGYFVTADGVILTNNHVVDGCIELRVKGYGVALVEAADDRIDLALLSVKNLPSEIAVFRQGRGVRTGEDVVVIGFPLAGFLSDDPKITNGIVSSLAGIGGDRNFVQITAPVQPGNSGGPLLDKSGNVVGTVVSKIDLEYALKRYQVVPENINFAVSGGSTRAFLDEHDVPYRTSQSNKKIPTVAIASKAKKFTIAIECWK